MTWILRFKDGDEVAFRFRRTAEKCAEIFPGCAIVKRRIILSLDTWSTQLTKHHTCARIYWRGRWTPFVHQTPRTPGMPYTVRSRPAVAPPGP